MASNANAARAGAFIVGAAVVSLAVVVLVSSPDFFQEHQQYVAVFRIDDDLQGLKQGDDVQLGGFRVGSVKAVDIVEAPPKQVGATTAPSSTQMSEEEDASGGEVRVTITVPKRYQLRKGAAVKVSGLIGGAKLNIYQLGDPNGELLQKNGEIAGTGGVLKKLDAAAAKMDKLMARLNSEIVPDVKSAVQKYGKLADDGSVLVKDVQGRIEGVIEKYNRVADSAATAMTHVGDFIGPGDGPASKDFKSAMADIKDTTASLKKNVPELQAKVSTLLDTVQKKIDGLDQTLADLKETMANAKGVTGKLDTTLADNKAKINRIISSLEGTVANAKLFSAEVLRRPSRLIWRDDEKTQENLAVYHSARDFAEGAQELNDAAASLRDAIKDPRISDAEVRRRLEQLDAMFEKFGPVEQKLYQSVKE
jgi:ABC-type transporter Mla subunit MlaD